MNVDPCLIAYGFVAALAAPLILRGFNAVPRAPRLGITAWMAAALSVPVSWLVAALSLAHHPGPVAPAIGFALAIGVTGRLAWVTLRTWSVSRSRRARHADAARLLGQHDPVLDALVVDFPDPVAYCLPTATGGIVVVSSGACAKLSARQLRAVIAHEREHLDGHHHLLLTAVHSLARFVPQLQLFRRLGIEVGRLLEMRADDVAARRHGRRTVAAAITAMAPTAAPAAAMGAGGSSAAVRAIRLIQHRGATPRDRLGLVITTFLLAAGPFIATLPPCPHPW
jgi:Zn-dependent protease with chaperone function